MTDAQTITQLLGQARAGDASAFDRAFALIHEQLRAVAHRQLRQRGGGTLCTTSLVNEAWLKLARANLDARDRAHFLALAARAMRSIVMDDARRRLADKRGGQHPHYTLDANRAEDPGSSHDLLALDVALHALARHDPGLAQVVEWRYFGGLTEPEVADLLDLNERTVRRYWRKARAFLHAEISHSRALT